MTSLTYRGYTAVVELDLEDGILSGEVIGLRDVITFEVESVPQAVEEFHASVDFYLDVCARRGQEPEKSYSGNFMVRIGPESHRKLAYLAVQRDISINSVVTAAITRLVEPSKPRDRSSPEAETHRSRQSGPIRDGVTSMIPEEKAGGSRGAKIAVKRPPPREKAHEDRIAAQGPPPRDEAKKPERFCVNRVPPSLKPGKTKET